MDNRTQINALQHCKTWLIHNEYSPATIEKYTHASVHFLADTATGKSQTMRWPPPVVMAYLKKATPRPSSIPLLAAVNITRKASITLALGQSLSSGSAGCTAIPAANSPATSFPLSGLF